MILHSPAFAAMCALLVPVADLYDRMHDLPVVQKRKRCQEMAVHRDRIAKEPAFTKVGEMGAGMGPAWQRYLAMVTH